MIESESPVAGIRSAVAKQEGVEPSDLPPIQEFVGSEAFRTLSVSWDDVETDVELTYVWYQITVHPSGEIDVE